MDRIRESARAGRVVLWEEIARDGAQAGTLLPVGKRIEVARRSGAMFGEHGPDHLIFAAGFPSVAREELEWVRQIVDQVDNCALATHGRATRKDIDLGLQALAGAPHGRVTFFVPVSADMAGALLHKKPEQMLRHSREMVRYAVDRADGLAIDVALADASRAEAAFVADAANQLTEEGAAIVKFCDSMGALRHDECRRLLRVIGSALDDQVTLGVHLHNDLGLGLASNVEAFQLGIRVFASSWLGLGERVGLAPTEQLLFLLATRPPNFESGLWLSPPNLHDLVPLVHEISDVLKIARRPSDPIIGPGVNRWSTGAPCIAPAIFRSFDAEAVLGVAPRLVLTHLTNHRVVRNVAQRLGYELTIEQAREAMRRVKSWAYTHEESEIPDWILAEYLAKNVDR